MSTTATAAKQGRLAAWWSDLFGAPDPIEEQLKEIGRQGSGIARWAHLCATLLIILFSAGSLVALGGDALQQIYASWSSGTPNVPAIISLAVSTLLVVCMDAAMLYAAMMIRLLSTRRAEPSEMRIHLIVIVTVSIIESGTYLYMSAIYEHPANPVAWTLIAARALSAPLLGVYLSMARPLPITARDILAQVERASGRGLILDSLRIANDPTAPLLEKMALFNASAVMTDADAARLNNVLTTLANYQEPRLDPRVNLRPSPQEGEDPAGPDPAWTERPSAGRRAATSQPRLTREQLKAARYRIARRILAIDRAISTSALASRIAMATHASIPQSTVYTIKRDVLAELDARQPPAEDTHDRQEHAQ